MLLTIITIKDRLESNLITIKDTSKLEKLNSDKASFSHYSSWFKKCIYINNRLITYSNEKNISKYDLDKIENYVIKLINLPQTVPNYEDPLWAMHNQEY
jgi:hypothetical protein